MVIRPDDRVARVLDADERLVEVFAAASPHFGRLRSPSVRRVMARLVTIRQAGRVAGVPVDALVARLNDAAGASASIEPTTIPDERNEMTMMDTMPPALAAVPDERIVELDVRDALRRGEEPFARIMAARKALAPGEVLRLRAIFEPAPLYAVMGKQGFSHWTERLADDDWRVWFHREDAPASAPSADPPDPAAMEDDGVVVLDVRGLEPPEPMVRTLAALEALPEGGTLVQVNVRAPQFLLPRLDEMGWQYDVREQGDEFVRVFIRRRTTR